jgi:hypothetical protein
VSSPVDPVMQTHNRHGPQAAAEVGNPKPALAVETHSLLRRTMDSLLSTRNNASHGIPMRTLPDSYSVAG